MFPFPEISVSNPGPTQSVNHWIIRVVISSGLEAAGA